MAGVRIRRWCVVLAALGLAGPALAAPSVPHARTLADAVNGLILPVSTADAAKPGKAGAQLSAADLSLYRQAFAQMAAGHWDDAVELASRAREKLPGKVILWTWLSAKESGATFQDITAFIDANPDWPRRETLQRRAEEAIQDETPLDVQRAWFLRNPPVSPTGRMRMGEALMASGQIEAGEAAIRAAYADPDLPEEDERRLLARDGRILRAEDHQKRLDALLWEGEINAAKRAMTRVDGNWAALAEARLALRQRMKNASSLVASVPPSLANNPGLLYERARWLRLADRTDEADRLLLGLSPATIAANPEKWWTERRLEARQRLRQGSITDAYALARDHGMTDGQGFVEAEFLAGWIALRFLNDPKTAYGHFTQLHQTARFPVSKARGAYWAGRAAETAGETAKAQRWYADAARFGTAFYGQLAAASLGSEAALQLPTDPTPTAAERAAFESKELVRAARMLGQLGEKDRVRPFIVEINADAMNPAERQLTADLAAQLDRPDLAVAAAKESERAGVPLITRGYPVIKLPKVSTEPGLVLALTRQESAFATDAVSQAGARGLMQLMPGTAKIVAKSLKVKFDQKRLTTDPAYNMMLGSAHLADLVDNYGGSYIMALAAYNAGPGRVSQWVRDYGDPRSSEVDVIDWIESIPFEETRTYVQRVMEGLQVYRQRLAQNKRVPLRLAQDLERASAPRQAAIQRTQPAARAAPAAPATPPAGGLPPAPTINLTPTESPPPSPG